VVLPISARLTGAFGLNDLYLSLPCLIGAQGVLRVLEPDLRPDERLALLASAEVLRSTLDSIA
jgi:L-lactate dehydrogenase